MEKDVTLNLHLEEDETDTKATATLDLRGEHFEAVGMARRAPGDKPTPIVGEELAIARALQDLTTQLAGAAYRKIEEFVEPTG